MSASYAVFFISTGRCGTQWFASGLTSHFHDLAVVRHEVLHEQYEPRRYFRAFCRKDNMELSPAIENHLTIVWTVTGRGLQYIETGWPVYGALPFILAYPNRFVKVVHLCRHPVSVAASLATHRVYSRGNWTDKMSIQPTDADVLHAWLGGGVWSAISTFEKCLFWWTAINLFAMDLRKHFPAVPWHSIRYEDVFSQRGHGELSRLLAFLNLPQSAGFLDSRSQVVDRYHLKTDDDLDVRELEKYPITLDVMNRLGYLADEVTPSQIRSRYQQVLP